MKIALVAITAIVALVGALPANSEVFSCRDSSGQPVLLDTPCPGSRQPKVAVEAPLPSVFPVDSVRPELDPFGPAGKAPIYPLITDVTTDTRKRGSYLDRFSEGAVKGGMFIVLAFFYLALHAFIRKAKVLGSKDYEIKDIQKLLCIGILVIVIAMAVYPPFQVHLVGRASNVGYGWIFSPPFGGAASIDIAMLIAQWVVVVGLGAVAFVFLSMVKSNIQSQAMLQERGNAFADPKKTAPEGRQGDRHLQASKLRRDITSKVQDAETCPNCGGPRQDGACWSCGMRM